MTRGAAVAIFAAAVVSACGSPDRQSSKPERHLVYIDRRALWIADVDGNARRKLVASAGYGIVAPSGHVIGFERRFGAELWTVRSDGTHARRIARNGRLIRWIDDGRILMWRRGRIVVLDARSGAITDLTEANILAGVAFSPDRQRLVYGARVAGRHDPVCGPRTDLFVIRLDGRDRRRLTHDGRSSSPVWTPRGILFQHAGRTCFIASGIWSVQPDGSHLTPIVRHIPRRYNGNGFYGLRPYSPLSVGRLLVGIRSEWGDYAAVIDHGRLTELHRLIDEVSRDGRWFVGTQGGAELPYDIAVVRVGGRTRIVAHGEVCCPSWNR